MSSELANPQLIIDRKVYELFEITTPFYQISTIDDFVSPSYYQEGKPDENFLHQYNSVINTTQYKAIRLGNKYYAHKLIGVMLPLQEENPDGLYMKYFISKIDGTPVDPNNEYFILKLSGEGDEHHINACKTAVLAYAEAIRDHSPKLAEDLINRYSNINV